MEMREVKFEPWDDFEEKIMELSKMMLFVPHEVQKVHLDFLSNQELEVVARQVWKEKGQNRSCNLVVTPEKGELPEGWDRERIQKMRERIHRDYDGVVLREEIVPDPPVRGMFGYAHIPLQENAVQQRQTPFCMHGERQEAYKKLFWTG